MDRKDTNGNILLPEGISERKIQYAFINNPKCAQIMRDFNAFDENKSLAQNIISFLGIIAQENLYEKLWQKIQEHK